MSSNENEEREYEPWGSWNSINNLSLSNVFTPAVVVVDDDVVNPERDSEIKALSTTILSTNS